MLSYCNSRQARLVIWLAIVLTTFGANAQSNVCVPTVGGLAGKPVLDGQVTGDPGWNNAVQLNLSGDLGSPTFTQLLLGMDASFLYLGLVVNGLPITSDTTVVLTFSATADNTDAADDWRINIQPFDVAPPPDNTKNLSPFVVTYWRNSMSWNGGVTGTPAGSSDWQKANAKIYKIDSVHWQMEFEIPLRTPSSNAGGFCLNCSGPGNFRIYVNVLSTNSNTVLPPEWISGGSYTSGQLVVVNNEEYQCNQASCTGAMPPSPGWQDEGPLFPADWVSSQAYPQLSRVVYNSEEYLCNQASGCAAGATPGSAGSGWQDTGPVPALSEDVWPPCLPTVICSSVITPTLITNQLDQLTPATSVWGTGWTSPQPACTGVSLKAYTNPLQVGIVPTSNLGAALTTNILADLKDVTETSLAQCQALPDKYVPSGTFNSPSNTFVAKPNNNMTNAAQVSVAFRLADFGIPGVDPSLGGSGLFPPLGNPVPPGCTLDTTTPCDGVMNNPTAQSPPAPDPGAFVPGDYTFQSTTWQLNYKQTCLFKYANLYYGTPHQCVQVVMDSTDPNTVFLNHSVEENLNFVQSSTFRQYAVIHGSQGNVPSPTRFLLALDTDEDGPIGSAPPKQTTGARTTVSTGASASGSGGAAASQVPRFRDQDLAAITRQQVGANVTNMFQWIIHGYVYTGTKLAINGHQYEYVRRAGDFGYVAGHTGEITGWGYKFQGSDLQEVNPYLYTVLVDPGKTTTVETTITAEPLPSTQAGKFAVFLDLGANFPQGMFSTAFKNGFSLNAGLEYVATNHFSLEGIFGYHEASAKVGGTLDIYQFSGDAKFYFLTGNVRPFINGGIGGYAFSPGSTHFGGNVGGGVLFTINSHWGLQGSYNFHAVNTPVSTTQFSTLQGGIRYVF